MSIKRKPKKITSKLFTFIVDAGSAATCGDPTKCLLALQLKGQGFHGPRVTAKTIKFSVPPDHPRAAELGVGTWELNTPGEIGYFIGSYDNGEQTCQTRTIGQSAVFTFSLDDPSLEAVFRVRVPKSEEAKRQLREYFHSRPAAIRNKQLIALNKVRVRRGEEPLSAEEYALRFDGTMVREHAEAAL